MSDIRYGEFCCFGYGLWGVGSPDPMGKADAEDGLPTVPCPVCGASANPSRPRKLSAEARFDIALNAFALRTGDSVRATGGK